MVSMRQRKQTWRTAAKSLQRATWWVRWKPSTQPTVNKTNITLDPTCNRLTPKQMLQFKLCYARWVVEITGSLSLTNFCMYQLWNKSHNEPKCEPELLWSEHIRCDYSGDLITPGCQMLMLSEESWVCNYRWRLVPLWSHLQPQRHTWALFSPCIEMHLDWSECKCRAFNTSVTRHQYIHASSLGPLSEEVWHIYDRIHSAVGTICVLNAVGVRVVLGKYVIHSGSW